MAIPGRSTDRRTVCAGAALWIAGPVTYLVFEGIAAEAFTPAYSYAQNYISDLGITVQGMSSGRLIDSPRAAWMNTAFCVQGVSFLAGAILIVRGLRSRRPSPFLKPFLALAAANAVGNILVATVHSGPAWGAGGPTWLHPTGAVLAIVGGNAAIFAGRGWSMASRGGRCIARCRLRLVHLAFSAC